MAAAAGAEEPEESNNTNLIQVAQNGPGTGLTPEEQEFQAGEAEALGGGGQVTLPGGETIINPPPPITVYRVVDPTELAYLQANGNYGSNPSQSGKYFALTLEGAQAFASAPMNAGSTITSTALPQSVVNQGFLFTDPGQYGAGPSVFFGQPQLPSVYSTMTPPTILPGGQ